MLNGIVARSLILLSLMSLILRLTMLKITFRQLHNLLQSHFTLIRMFRCLFMVLASPPHTMILTGIVERSLHNPARLKLLKLLLLTLLRLTLLLMLLLLQRHRLTLLRFPNLNFMGWETKKQAERQHGYDVDMLQREQQFNAEQAQVAYDREREFYNYQFDKESKYNSPVAQMQRYKAAGLNPYLMEFDDGNTSVSPSSQSAASASGSNTVDMVGIQNSTLQALRNASDMAQGIQSIANQTRLADSQQKLNTSQEVKNLAEAAKTSGVDTDKVKEDIKNIAKDTELKEAERVNKEANTRLTDAQRENVQEDTRRLTYMVDKFLPKQYDEIVKRIEDLGSQISSRQQITKAEVAELEQRVFESISRMNLNESQRDYMEKQIGWYDKNMQQAFDMNNEQFQQLKSRTAFIKNKNSLVNDILMFDHSSDNFRDTHFRDKVFRLRALMTLDPNVSDQFQLVPSSGLNYLHPTNSFNFND